MARRSSRRLIEDLASQLEPRMRRAFQRSIDEIQSDAQITAIAKALQEGNIERALRLIGLDTVSFRGVERALEEIFETGGIAVSNDIRSLAPRGAVRLLIRFDIRNPRAERWLRDQSSRLVRELVDEQLDMLRTALEQGLRAGKNPRTVALDVMGRLNKLTGRREGGVLGLTKRMATAGDRYLDNLLSGDPERMRGALRLKLRDRRFDSTVRKAIRDGRPISAADARKMARAYRNRALRNRGETIARTETLDALQEAKHEAFRQTVERGAARPEDVRRFWRTAQDELVSDEHRLIPGMNSDGVGLEEPFQTPSGPVMRSPARPRCRCDVDIRIDFIAGVLDG